jgi:glycosyltransferase involved in cell wall biosynthesis
MVEVARPGTPAAVDTDAVPTKGPLTSVVIPTHNRAALLARAIRSVQAQTYDNLEIIVVDDLSTDNTRDIVQGFGDPRIRYIRHETNRGGSAARNTGIRAARGDVIAFLDDDDEWDPLKTEEQLQLLDRYDAVMCMYSIDGTIVRSPERDIAVTLDELRRGLVRGASASALMVRSHVVKNIMFDEKLPNCQDWDLCIGIAQKYSIGCLDKPLVRYNDGRHDRISNKITQLSAAEVERRMQMLEKHKQFLGPAWYNRHMSRFLLYGVRRGPDRMAHVRYVARHYGVLNVARALSRRVWAVLIARMNRKQAATR